MKATPVPIPNTEVKFHRADDTWGATPWESKTSLVLKDSFLKLSFLFFCFLDIIELWRVNYDFKSIKGN